MLIEEIFDKTIEALTEEDLKVFFSKPQFENDKIEFKSSKEYEYVNGPIIKEKDMPKKIIDSICAFLNTDGGIIIWGAPEGKEQSGKKEKVFQGDLAPVKYLLEKDQFISRVASLLNPTPNRFNFKPISVGAGGFVYVIEVARSQFSPHQHNGIYFMRLDGQTRFAPHQYVEALMKKISIPKLEIVADFGEMILARYAVLIPFTVSVVNRSKLIQDTNVTLRILSDFHLLEQDQQLHKMNNGGDKFLRVADTLHNGTVRCWFYLLAIDSPNDAKTVNAS